MKTQILLIPFFLLTFGACSSNPVPESNGPAAIQPNPGTGTASPTPVNIRWQRLISMSETGACAITPAGALKCWGDNSNGIFANDNKDSQLWATDSLLTSGVQSISISSTNGCANVNGAAQCWGSNVLGQLGTASVGMGVGKESLKPVQVDGLTANVTSIATGGSYFACAVVGGAVKCWGANTYGTLGTEPFPFETAQSFDPPAVDKSQTPVDIPGLPAGVTLVTAGENHACALVNGGVKCWGKADKGQLGKNLGNSVAYSFTPVDVEGLESGVMQIAAGEDHTCAILSDGTIRCWGANDKGQLGDGTTTNQPTPVQVSGISSGATLLSIGNSNSCAGVDGTFKCWGYNNSGQLGNDATTDSLQPVKATAYLGVIADAPIKDAVTRGETTCIMNENNSVLCWGSNTSGQLGNGGTTEKALRATLVSNFPEVY